MSIDLLKETIRANPDKDIGLFYEQFGGLIPQSKILEVYTTLNTPSTPTYNSDELPSKEALIKEAWDIANTDENNRVRLIALEYISKIMGYYEDNNKPQTTNNIQVINIANPLTPTEIIDFTDVRGN